MSGRKLFRINFILMIGAVFILLVNLSAANNGASFLRMNVGSRAQGLGGAYTALSNDINGLYYNPAGMGFVVQPSMMLYHGQWIEDISLENISFLMPFKNNLSLAGGITYLHLPNIDRYEIDPVTGGPLAEGTFQAYDFIGQLGVAYRMGWDLSLGLTGKFFQERLDDVTASSFAFDAGILYHTPIDYLNIGFAVQNLGPGVKYQNTSEKLPLSYRMGIAYQLPYNAVTFSADAVKVRGENVKFYPGVEVEFLDAFSLRSGYEFGKDTGSGYSLGLGLKFMDKYQFNYVYAPYGVLGNTHRAELVIRLGGIVGNNFSENEYRNSKSAKKARRLLAEENLKQTHPQVEQLPIPDGLKAVKIGEKVLLSWRKVNSTKAKYNLYVEIPGKTKMVRINDSPLENNEFTFQPTVGDLNMIFYVTAVDFSHESNKSKPYQVHYQN